jgi:hypothetical protein
VNQINLGHGFTPLDFGVDTEVGFVNVRQGKEDIVVPKTHLRRFIEKLEALEKKLSP